MEFIDVGLKLNKILTQASHYFSHVSPSSAFYIDAWIHCRMKSARKKIWGKAAGLDIWWCLMIGAAAEWEKDLFRQFSWFIRWLKDDWLLVEGFLVKLANLWRNLLLWSEFHWRLLCATNFCAISISKAQRFQFQSDWTSWTSKPHFHFNNQTATFTFFWKNI